MRQQLFQPQRWKASQDAFLTHITTWQTARGEEEERKGGGGGEDLLLFPLGVYVRTLKNCFWMESQRDLYLDFGCLDNGLEFSATSSTAEGVPASGKELGKASFFWPLLESVLWFITEQSNTWDLVWHLGSGGFRYVHTVPSHERTLWFLR